MIKHAFIVLIVLIPLLRISRILFRKDKDKISLLEPCIFVRVSDDILDLFEVFAIVINVAITLSCPQFLGILLIVKIFIGLQVDPCGPVEAKRDH